MSFRGLLHFNSIDVYDFFLKVSIELRLLIGNLIIKYPDQHSASKLL